jgi:hypothetical protein
MLCIYQAKKQTILKGLKEKFPELKITCGYKNNTYCFKTKNDNLFNDLKNERIARHKKNIFEDDYLDRLQQIENCPRHDLYQNSDHPIIKTIKELGNWYNKSDVQKDYFDVAFYIDFEVYPSD